VRAGTTVERRTSDRARDTISATIVTLHAAPHNRQRWKQQRDNRRKEFNTTAAITTARIEM
jgi:hypothetical protein